MKNNQEVDNKSTSPETELKEKEKKQLSVDATINDCSSQIKDALLQESSKQIKNFANKVTKEIITDDAETEDNSYSKLNESVKEIHKEVSTLYEKQNLLRTQNIELIDELILEKRKSEENFGKGVIIGSLMTFGIIKIIARIFKSNN